MLTDAIEIDKNFVIPPEELYEEFFLSSGPGGQNVNKVSTAVRLSWNLYASRAIPEHCRERLLQNLAGQINRSGTLSVCCRNSRSQLQNREEAVHLLQQILRKALYVPKKRRPTCPTASSVRRRLENKRRTGERKKSRSFRGNLED